MRYIIFFALVLGCFTVKAQTPIVIPATTTVEAFSNMAPGKYLFYGTGPVRDTTILSNIACPVTVCPPVVICPPVPRPRNAIGFTITKGGQVIVTYDTGPVTTFTLRNNVIVQ